VLRLREERGAIAILAAIVVLFVALPLAAIGMTTYVREGSLGELQRAADAGALAGAASIPLGDINFVRQYVDNPVALGLGSYFSAAPNPLDVACEQARLAIGADGTFGDEFSTAGATALPACSQGTTSVGSFSITAEFLPDTAFTGTLLNCLNDLVGINVTSLVPAVGNLLSGARNALPALLQAGVKVTVMRAVQGPLDNVLGGSGETVQTAEAAAKRRFKNAVVVPTIDDSLLGLGAILPGSSGEVDLNPAAGQTIDSALSLVEGLGNLPVLSSLCPGLVTSLTDDLGDLLNPPVAGVAPSVEEVLQEAAGEGEQIFVLRYVAGLGLPGVPCIPIPLVGGCLPGTGTVGIPLLAPFLDFVPVCNLNAATLKGEVGPLVAAGTCSVHAPGAFRGQLVPVDA
jgi:hypothetical protein